MDTSAQSEGSRSLSQTPQFRSAFQPPPGDRGQAERAHNLRQLAAYSRPSRFNLPVPPVKIYFPPNPPRLGEELKDEARDFRLDHAHLRSLEADLLEPYYAPLSTRLLEPDHPLSKVQQARLEKHRATRTRLLQTLRARLGELAGATLEERRTGLAALAQIQQAELVASEKEAEKLRSELAPGVNWFVHRRWRLRTKDLAARAQSRELESQLLRAVAFYQDGITPEQRRLLLEASRIEEEAALRERAEPVGAPPVTFFSPDLLPVAFPENLPAELVEQISQFQREKDAIRRELQDAVYRSERIRDDTTTRRWELRTLRKQHAPRLRALEDKAEEIRLALAAYDSTWRRRPPSALPETLEQDIAAYLEAKRRFRDGFALVLAQDKVTLPSPELGKDPAAAERWKEERLAHIEQASEEYAREHRDEAARIDTLLLSIIKRIATHLPSDQRASAADTADAHLERFARRRQQEQAYYEYELAAFEPGLSPEQRRLLFGAAVARLDLPLGMPEM